MRRTTISITEKQDERLNALRRNPKYSLPTAAALIREILDAGLDVHESKLMQALAEPTHPTPLAWLQDNCVSVHIDVNDHRSRYQTVGQWFAEATPDVDLFVAAECVKRDQLVVVQAYPDTPIGSYQIIHHDIEAALAETVVAIKSERRSRERLEHLTPSLTLGDDQ
jgi:nitrogen fixation/metabolism regulation signal transduction histidine kinase